MWYNARSNVNVPEENEAVAENGKRSGFVLMDEMEQKQQSGTKENASHEPRYWKRGLRRSFEHASEGLDLKLPWIMLAGMFILVLDETFGDFPGWVSDAAIVIAIIGAVQYVISTGIRIYHKKKNRE